MVELSSHEVGIVVTNNTARRLEPKVMIVMDSKQNEMKTGKVIDLSSTIKAGVALYKLTIVLPMILWRLI